MYKKLKKISNLIISIIIEIDIIYCQQIKLKYKLATQPLLETLPKDYHKMPSNYDFSHKRINWKEHEKDFVLRTDAVWEKDQLKDWFRLYTKVRNYQNFSVFILIQQQINIL
ncbi:unnamed protein product [Paramecium sonneborni]|uniref:Uncharacterized protein n=1 Tax=Paramecium sonneborni TaxID=65129 RepID=A0A8S1KZU3_9CILI|nr:unnamed protein product [Paramecium sonneborni]